MESVLKSSFKSPRSYYIHENIGLTKEERKELGSELEKAGFKYFEPQMGGGGDGITEAVEVIASLNFNDKLFDLAIGLTGSAIYDGIKKIQKWLEKRNKKRRNVVQVVDLHIYTPVRGRGNAHFLRVRLDKQYTQREIREALEKMKREQPTDFIGRIKSLFGR